MRLYLSSIRIPAPDDLAKLIGKPLSRTSVALIPNAKDYYTKRPRDFVVGDLAGYMERLGLKVDLIDLRDYKDSGVLRNALAKYDLIWAMGGNTYMLRYEMRRSGFDTIIKGLLEDGVVYGGDSAGAIVAGPSIAGIEAADEPAFAKEVIKDGAGLVPFVVMPHIDNPKFAEIMPIARGLHKHMIELKDSQAVIFDGDKHWIVDGDTHAREPRMGAIEHNITAIKQNAAECMQTATAQMLSFYDSAHPVGDIIRDVPVYVENGEKIGTSPGHLASYLAKLGYQTTVHVFDVELFDRSWSGLSSDDVLEKLHQRQQHIPNYSWLAKYKHVLVDGWEQYVAAGGKFSFEPLSEKLMYGLLNSSPYLLMVNSTYLNQSSKQAYDQKSGGSLDDDIEGRSLTHAVTCAGYRDGEFLIVDPDPPKGTDHHRWIAQDHLIASIMSAQTESDNFLISIG